MPDIILLALENKISVAYFDLSLSRGSAVSNAQGLGLIVPWKGIPSIGADSGEVQEKHCELGTASNSVNENDCLQ